MITIRQFLYGLIPLSRVLLFFTATILATQAAAPVITNIRASQRAGTHLIDIYYNVSDPDGNSPLTIHVAISSNGGASYNVPVFTLSGAVGPNVAPGNDRHIIWNAGTDWPGQFSSQCRVRIIADDGTSPAAPQGMAYIPGGVFRMGDNFYEQTEALPVHNLYISPFFIDKFEVTRELWLDIYSWAIGHGYSLSGGAWANGENHPIRQVSWFNAVAWCNARSERQGLVPVYYSDVEQTLVVRAAASDISNFHVKWDANGFRLPTEAEWEKAARGGAVGQRFPFGNVINNYDLANVYIGGVHPWGGGTTPVGSFPPNTYGLHDTVGNILEWCWDTYITPYRNLDGEADPRGPLRGTSSVRVQRGGFYGNSPAGATSSYRTGHYDYSGFDHVGFRCVRGI